MSEDILITRERHRQNLINCVQHLEKFKKKRPGPAYLREKQIKDISKAKNLPILVFTHPKDPYDGLLSNWVEKIPGIKRIVISEKYKINSKRAFE